MLHSAEVKLRGVVEVAPALEEEQEHFSVGLIG